MKAFYKIKPIGVVHSRFKTREEGMYTTIDENFGEIEIFSEYAEGLSDIEGCSHIIVIFWMHKSSFTSLMVRPRHHPEKSRGVFATRSPDRPNPLGMTILELIERKGNILKVKRIDMIDGTPVLDIKPYTKHEKIDAAECGWLFEK